MQIAIEELPVTLHGARCLVLGYGRIGKILSKALHDLGADTCVSARRHSDLAWIRANNLRGVYTKDIEEGISAYQVIFNTIPAKVLSGQVLDKLDHKTLIIDLASKPGGEGFGGDSEIL